MVIGKKLAAGIALAMMIAAPASADWWASDRGGSASTSSKLAQAKKPAPAKAEAPRRKPVPEPADFALFAAGVIGLLIGRQGSRIRRRRD